LKRGAESLVQVEGGGADGEQECGAGMGSVEFARQGEEFRSPEVVSGWGRIAGGGLDGRKEKRAGSGGGRCVDEEDGSGGGEVFGEVGSPLLEGEYADGGFGAEAIRSPGG
jgi:hypothetical protein